MYLCQICHKTVPPRTKAHRIAIETRPRHYPYRPEVHPVMVKGKLKFKDDPGGTGYEIVREVTACPACASRHRNNESVE